MKYEVKARGRKEGIIISQEQGEKLKELMDKGGSDFVEFGLHKIKLSLVEGIFPIYETTYDPVPVYEKRSDEEQKKMNQTLQHIGDLLRKKGIIK